MLKNKISAVIAIIILSVSAVFAEKNNLKEPKKGNVFIVGKVVYKKPIDLKAHESFKDFKIAYVGDKQEFCLVPEFSQKTSNLVSDGLDGYFYEHVKVPDDGKIYLEYIKGRIFGSVNPWFLFALPAGVTITVPDDAVYVYIGTFEYDLDYALRTVGFRHLDDYAEASKTLNRRIGKNVELYRAALSFEKKDK